MTSSRYDAVAITLHWVIALGIGLQIVMGWGMTHLPLPMAQKFWIYQFHKSVGITVLLAVVVRVLWRFTHKPPALPEAMPRLERAAATGTHHLLYTLMFVVPLAGWAVVSLSPYNIPTVLYGLIPWPDLPVFGANKAVVEPMAETVHSWAAYIIAAVVVVHAAAALRHQFCLRDGILRRMIPFLKE